MEYTPIRLLSNIYSNYQHLRADFIGISFDLNGFLYFLLYIFFVLVLFIVFYLIGGKITRIFFKIGDSRELRPFISIALGYILVGSGIAILGMFSLFYPVYLLSYILFLIAFSLYPLHFFKQGKEDILFVIGKYRQSVRDHPWLNAAIFGFLLIGFLRLIPPETGPDAIWYHTDYPALYLKTHSMMGFHPRGNFQIYPIVTPTLGDMYYVITQFFNMKDAGRVLHYGFYVVVILLYIVGLGKKMHPYNLYACLLLVTSPVVIRHTSTAYGEFQWMLCWLLAVVIVTGRRNITNRKIVLSAILFGGTLATKLWMLPFYGVFILYLCLSQRTVGLLRIARALFLFILVAFLVPLAWYIRAYISTGNPLFPTFQIDPSGQMGSIFSIFPVHAFSLGNLRNHAASLFSISPFSIVALLFLFVGRSKKSNIRIKSFSLFVVILVIIHFIINYSHHRFILPFYSAIVLVLGAGFYKMLLKYPISRPFFLITYGIMFSYYFLNTLLILPYGIGWADSNRYLTRILSTDNSSYYDYGRVFSPLISKNDRIATYGLWGFYYADFDHFYSEDIFRDENKSLEILVKKGATKLLVKGGDIGWLCRTLQLSDCSKDRYQFLGSYLFTYAPASQYLYALTKIK